MAENIFNEKQDYIVAARDEVIKRDEYAANIDRMKQQQKKLSRSIASEEKSIADEIATTIKKRRQEIQSTYDDRLDDNRARKKKVANKRDKKKEERMERSDWTVCNDGTPADLYDALAKIWEDLKRLEEKAQKA